MNGANAAVLPDITLDELERLIRLLGMIASQHDGEALNAARLAQRWVAEHQTDWRTLLTPEPEQAVVGVAAPAAPDALEAAHQADRAQAFKNGYAAGMRDMAAQVKAQATMAQGGPGGGLGGSGQATAPRQGPAAQGPVRPSQAPQQTASAPWPAGSWQAVAVELLDRDLQGVPGVFRGSRETDFVTSLLARRWPSLTGPQETWLRDIAGRSGLTW